MMNKALLPWTVKYAPTSLSAIPQPGVTENVLSFLESFPKKKGLILVGPPGVGKTTLVYALAAEKEFEVVETNASDYRTAKEIESKVGAAATQASLFGSKKLLLIDEIDGLAGNKDRGGIPALAKVLQKSVFPVICTAADIDDRRYSKLKRMCVVIEVPPVDTGAAASVLAIIAEREGMNADESLFKSMARRSAGDLRALINDFQALSRGAATLTQDMVESLASRDKAETVQPALVKVIKNSDAALARGAFDMVGMDLKEALLWVEYNVGKEYKKPADINRAFDAISRADVFFGRIRRWQHWRYLVYISDLLTAGVASAKDQKYPGMSTYKRSTRLLKMWQAKMRNAKRNAVAEKLAQATHTSKRRVIQDMLPYIRRICGADGNTAEALGRALDLDEDQRAWLST